MIEELDALQERLDTWNRKNFGTPADTFHITKLTEEVGEAAHAVVRLYHRAQGKKVNPNSEEKLRDALGDIVVILMHLANSNGWQLSDAIQDTCDEVLARDYSERA